MNFLSTALLVLLVALSLPATAQPPTYSWVNGTASNNGFPFGSTSSNRVQWLYRPTQFPTAGAANITDIYFTSSAATNSVYSNLTISMGTSTLNALVTGPWNTGLQQVFVSASQPITTTAGGWFKITLQTPWYYDGVSNFIVDVWQTGYTGGFSVSQDGTYPGGRLYAAYNAATATGNTGLAWFGFDSAPAGPCTSPPTPGTTTTTNTTPCGGSTFALNLLGNSTGLGQTYQWQTAPAAAGPYTNVGPASSNAYYNATATTTLYYRCALTCGATTAYSTPLLITVPALFPGGTYTINSALPTAGSNFQTFNAAVAAIACGTTGPVIFNVAAGSGPYSEQVTIPNIPTNSAINTITFNGNNTALNLTNTNASNYAVLRLNGARFITFKKLNITASSSGTSGFGVLMTNGAKRNMIDSCTIDVGITATSTAFGGVLIGSSSTAYLTASSACDSNIVSNNTILGGYAGVICYSTTAPQQQYNQIINNVIRDYYVYGTYFYYNNNMQVVGNELHRMNRTTVSTFYGIMNTTGNTRAFISKNRIHNPFGAITTSTSAAYFMYNSASATAGNENVFSNNIVYNMDGNGTQYIMYSTGNFGSWYYNTISCDHTAATAGVTYGYYQTSTYTGITFRNNIISLTRGGAGAKYAIYNSAAGYATVYNNNNYYVTGATNNVGYAGAAQATLANWQTVTTQDALSMSVNPNFVAATTGNLTPTNLAMDNIGVTIAGITTDITNFPRSATPDAGAFEFNNCNAPTGLAASAYTTSSATISWNAVTGSAGYEYVLDQVVGNPAGAGTATLATSFPSAGLNSATTYYAHVRNKCGTAAFSPWVTIPVTTCTQASSTPTGNVTFCTGGSMLLTANTGTSYQWKLSNVNIPGATNISYTITAAGVYTVTVNSTNGCSSTSAAVTAAVTSPSSVISPAGPVTVCPGSTTPLTAPAGAGYTYQWNFNGTPIGGPLGIGMVYNVGQAGNYTVTVSSSATCNTTSATPTAVNLHPVTPAVITPPASTAICPGSPVTLVANSGTGLTYQWYLNNVLQTGATNIIYANTGIGNYTVRVTKTANTCASTSPAITITQASAPPAVATAVTVLAACDTVKMTGNTGTGYTYQWLMNGSNIPGANNIIYAAPYSAAYSVRVTGPNGCGTTSAAINATVYQAPTSIITYSSPLSFCYGGGVILTSFYANGYSYQWLLNGNPIAGDTSFTKTVSDSGNYSIRITSNNGCIGTSPQVTVAVNQAPAPVVTVNGSMLITGTYAAYQWYFNGQPIPGANNATYTYTADGGYRVAATDANGCMGLSATVTIKNTTSVTNVTGGEGIKIYPNPASEYVHIDAPVTVNAVIRDLAGRTVIYAADAKKIDISTLANGAYMILVTDQQGNTAKMEKLFKIK